MKFRSKPVVISARELTTENVHDVAQWCGGEVNPDGNLRIETLEGPMLAIPGEWWVIKGTKGEFYPCRSDVFVEKYEPEDDSDEELLEDPEGAPYPDEIQHLKRFFLYRESNSIFDDQVGVIAVGTQFPDGKIALRWVRGPGRSTVVWDTLEEVVDTHCHEKSPTELVWVD